MKRVMAMVVLVIAAGCSVGRPPDAVALSLYTRNLSADAFAFTVIGSHSPAILGETGTEEPRSYGCGWVGRDWQLLVSEGAARPEPPDDLVAMASGDDYGDPDQLSIWIDVRPDGAVIVGDGVPAWWTHEKQGCG